MYEAFDSYLNVDTWHTSHPLDGRRFFKALDRVINEPNFNPDQMGEYMRAKKGVHNSEHPFYDVINRRVSDAWAVKEYFEAINH
jgi:hypothetical protein